MGSEIVKSTRFMVVNSQKEDVFDLPFLYSSEVAAWKTAEETTEKTQVNHKVYQVTYDLLGHCENNVQRVIRKGKIS